jgi:hypothetical protein
MEENTGAMQSASLVQAPSEKPLLSCIGTHRVPPLQRNGAFRPLCHEHHLEMSLTQVPLQTSSEPAHQTLVYACPEPDCFVHYDNSRGYFIVTYNGNEIDRDMMPAVLCSQDESPMYLAEVLQEQSSFRLWRCPVCNSKRRNNDDLSQAPATGNTSGHQPGN